MKLDTFFIGKFALTGKFGAPFIFCPFNCFFNKHFSNAKTSIFRLQKNPFQITNIICLATLNIIMSNLNLSKTNNVFALICCSKNNCIIIFQ